MAVSQALLGAARVSRLVPRKRARANMRLPFCMALSVWAAVAQIFCSVPARWLQAPMAWNLSTVRCIPSCTSEKE